MGRRSDRLDELPLSTRAKNVLRRAGCFSLEELSDQFEDFYDEVSGCGPSTRQELAEFVKAKSINLRPLPTKSVSYMLGELLRKIHEGDGNVDASRKELAKMLKNHPEFDWSKAE
jgi:hypothetical protein